jgi:uncharacterized protein YxjI
MDPSDFFSQRTQLYVRQRKEWAEILIDWETRNQYEVLDADGEELGIVSERARGARAFLMRGLLRSHRPFEIAVTDTGGALQLELSRSFFLLFSSLEVRGEDGRPVGSVERRFGVLHKRYDLLDEHGRKFAEIKSPRWKLWTFPVTDVSGDRQAVIGKKWGGGLREVFTDADTFRVDYGSDPWSDSERRVIFAAAISIDFDFFENNNSN